MNTAFAIARQAKDERATIGKSLSCLSCERFSTSGNNRFCVEAWRRTDADELADEELYPSDTQWSGVSLWRLTTANRSMPDEFTKAKRSEVMSRIRGRGNKDTENRAGKAVTHEWNHGVAAQSIGVWKTGFYFSKAARCGVDRWVFFALLSEAFKHACE